MAIDFIEACFQSWGNCGEQRGVDAINEILRDSATGFELTPFVTIQTDKPGGMFGRNVGRVIEHQYPQMIRVDSQYLHRETVQPAIGILSDSRFQCANQEFLAAHEHFRHGRFQECLNECLKVFESTLKIICHAKKWPYQQTDAAKQLIQICLNNGLIPTFGQQQLTSLRTLLESGIPTTRNKLSGHGQGVQPVDVPEAVAKYALHLTATTVVLLAESAQL
jgi:Domain of unknown function (DUF7014)